MNKILLFIFLVSSIYAKNVEIFGSMAVNENNSSLIKDAFFIEDNIFLTADEIVFYKNKRYVIAKNRVYMTYDNNSFMLSNFANIYLDSKNMNLYPFFVFDYSSEGWISAVKANKVDSKFYLSNVLSSSCNVKNPDWKVVSSSGNYNRDTKWVNLYNPTFYIYNVPVFYMPYFGFSLNKERKAGLLRPLFGYSVNEGVLYSQPLYIPFSKASDLEIIPTTRTARGNGIYSTYRFVDSNTSKGFFKFGYFNDNESYQKEFDLKNNKHYGYIANYNNDKLIFDKDSMYFDIEYANDVDFFYLDSINNSFDDTYLTDKTITSVFNYIYNGDTDYMGLYGKYFIDTSKTDNSDTLQILPEVHYHKFTNSYFLDKLVSNIDLDIQNYHRSSGDRYIKRTLNIPVSYNFSIFDDYVKVNLSETLYASDLKTHTNKLEANYYSLNTVADIYTSLSKKLNNDLYHTINFNLGFLFNNKTYRKGDNELITPEETDNNINIKLDNYLVSKDLYLKHNISQVFYDDKQYSNLYNYLYIKYNKFYILENNEYSHELDKSYYNSFSFGYNNDVLNILLSHIYKYEITKSYSLYSSFKLTPKHMIYAYYDYDYETQNMDSWYVGFKMSKKCWNYNLKFKQEITPILTNSGTSNMQQNTIYFEIEFNPIGGLEQSFMYKD